MKHLKKCHMQTWGADLSDIDLMIDSIKNHLINLHSSWDEVPEKNQGDV